MSGAIAGFYKLSATAIRYELLPADDRKRVTRYAMIPATLVGRLAAAEGSKRRPTASVRNCSRTCSLVLPDYESPVGALGVVVDAIDHRAQTFYEEYGFRLRMIRRSAHCLQGEQDRGAREASRAPNVSAHFVEFPGLPLWIYGINVGTEPAGSGNSISNEESCRRRASAISNRHQKNRREALQTLGYSEMATD
jgi:hypothetical protein